MVGMPVGPLVRGQPGSSRPLPMPLSRYFGNRDWTIPIECRASQVVLVSTGQTFPTANLRGSAGTGPGLMDAVRQLIARRQATVRSGEPPYRPVLRFQVHDDALRTYYSASAALEGLHLPATRENVETRSPARSAPFRP
jgi:hypothetical protein